MAANANPIGILLREPWIEASPNLQGVVEKLLAVGFDFLEIPEKCKYNSKELDYLQKLRRTGRVSFTLHSATPGGPVNLTNPKFSLGIKPTFRLAQTLKARRVIFDFDPVAAPKDKQKCYVIIKERVRASIKAAEDTGTIAAFENGDARDYDKCGLFKFGMIVGDFQRLIADFPDLKMTLDFGHLLASAGYWHFDWRKDFIKPLAPHIVHTHISDNFGKEGGYGSKSIAGKLGDLHLPLDMGRVPWREMITTLLEQGYSGGFTLEIKPENFSFTEEEVANHIETSYQLLSNFIRGG